MITNPGSVLFVWQLAEQPRGTDEYKKKKDRSNHVIGRFEGINLAIPLYPQVKFMNVNQQLITRFYTAFQQLDYKTMQDCYHEDAVFFDPVFQDLNAYEVRNMWEMLCRQSKDLSLQFSEVEADGEYGTCRWVARYSFSRSGRKVVNSVKAHFKFDEGKIIEHSDDFDLWKWSRQALGISGWLFGWSEFFQKRIRASAQNKLLAYLNSKSSVMPA